MTFQPLSTTSGAVECAGRSRIDSSKQNHSQLGGWDGGGLCSLDCRDRYDRHRQDHRNGRKTTERIGGKGGLQAQCLPRRSGSFSRFLGGDGVFEEGCFQEGVGIYCFAETFY